MQDDHANPGALRRGVLAASVLHDIPLEPDADGVRTGSSWDHRSSWASVTWSVLGDALNGADPESLAGRLRLRDWLRGRTITSDRGEYIRERAVVLALPKDHCLHPGASWVVESVLGGVLDLGIGIRVEQPQPSRETPSGASPTSAGTIGNHSGAMSNGDQIVPLPTTATQHVGLDTTGWWSALIRHRSVMATLAVDRLRRQGRGVLRPIGGCDVLSLLSDKILREYVADSDGTGMRALAVPMRSRAWFDLARIDPAYVGAAATATDPEHRGVTVPLLVTTDAINTVMQSVTLPEVARSALADPAGNQPRHTRDVLYR